MEIKKKKKESRIVLVCGFGLYVKKAKMISSNFKKNILIGTFERLLPVELVAAPSADRLDACELHKKTKYLAARLMVVQSCFLEWIPELPALDTKQHQTSLPYGY